MSFGRYELRINGEKRGDIESFEEVFSQIDDAYLALDDQYSGEVYWELEDWGNDDLKVARHKMEAGFWYAYAENAEAFRSWLKLFGWNCAVFPMSEES